MPDHNVIADVSLTLKQVLQDQFSTNIFPGTPIDVVLHDLRARPQGQNPLLSVFLYEIIEDPSARNRPRIRQPDPNGIRIRKPKQTLLLRYLFTAWSDDDQVRITEHRILGAVLRIFYNHPILSGSDLTGTTLPNEAEALKVTLAPITLEDRTRVWHAVQQPYRLSLTYEVRVVNLDSLDVPAVPVVRSREVEYGRMESIS